MSGSIICAVFIVYKVSWFTLRQMILSSILPISTGNKPVFRFQKEIVSKVKEHFYCPISPQWYKVDDSVKPNIRKNIKDPLCIAVFQKL